MSKTWNDRESTERSTFKRVYLAYLWNISEERINFSVSFYFYYTSNVLSNSMQVMHGTSIVNHLLIYSCGGHCTKNGGHSFTLPLINVFGTYKTLYHHKFLESLKIFFKFSTPTRVQQHILQASYSLDIKKTAQQLDTKFSLI